MGVEAGTGGASDSWVHEAGEISVGEGSPLGSWEEVAEGQAA